MMFFAFFFLLLLCLFIGPERILREIMIGQKRNFISFFIFFYTLTQTEQFSNLEADSIRIAIIIIDQTEFSFSQTRNSLPNGIEIENVCVLSQCQCLMAVCETHIGLLIFNWHFEFFKFAIFFTSFQHRTRKFNETLSLPKFIHCTT